LNKGGRLGFILPHKFFNAQYGEALRGLISEGRHLAGIIHFGDQQVFTGATTYTCLLFLDKAGVEECHYTKVLDLEGWKVDLKIKEMESGDELAEQSRSIVQSGNVATKGVKSAAWNFAVGSDAELVNRLKAMPTKLGDIADIFVGLQTSADDVFILDYVDETELTIRLRSKVLGREVVLEHELMHPLVSGQDVSGYRGLDFRQFILFPYAIADEKATLIPFDRLEKQWPKTAAYLTENRERLTVREKGKMKGPRWYGYIYLKNMTRQSVVKLCVPRLVDELCAAYDHDGSHFLDNVDVGGVTLKPEYAEQGLPYLLALLNSRLLRWFFPNVSAPFRGGWYSANRQFLSLVPIRLIDFSKPSDKAAHAQIVSLVEQMSALHRQAAAAKSPPDKEALERQIHAAARQIDEMVCELYGLTEDEIKIVEGTARSMGFQVVD
jgi:hypothetical protein